MKKNNHKSKSEAGFTLVELLVVIAIISILAGVVTVSMTGSVLRSKRASALTTASSVLPELVTCGDDTGFVRTSIVAGQNICVVSSSNSADLSGHTVDWPAVNAKTGWSYGSGSGTVVAGTFAFTLTKSGETTISCSMASNDCD
jgi:prepilin-type N-terminal cleavage/methylation domain-containing protein